MMQKRYMPLLALALVLLATLACFGLPATAHADDQHYDRTFTYQTGPYTNQFQIVIDGAKVVDLTEDAREQTYTMKVYAEVPKGDLGSVVIRNSLVSDSPSSGGVWQYGCYYHDTLDALDPANGSTGYLDAFYVTPATGGLRPTVTNPTFKNCFTYSEDSSGYVCDLRNLPTIEGTAVIAIRITGGCGGDSGDSSAMSDQWIYLTITNSTSTGGAVTVDPPKEKGDFGGVVIPAAIVGALVVAGGAVVLSRRGRKPKGDLPPEEGGPSDDDQQEEPPSTFRMVLWKDFGDCLRVGANPQTVGARIEELRPNLDNTVTVIERDDLTALIKITSGRYTHVVPTGMLGRHMTAQVDIPQGTAIDPGDKRAIVSFSLESEVGAVTSNAAFRIAGEPRITFPELTEDGTGWNEAVWNDVVRMVAGMGGSERLRFVIVDAPDEPTEISFSTPEALAVTAEKDAQLAFTYHACIENHTAPMEKEGGIFAEKQDAKVDVRAVFADGTAIGSNFTVELWPDGLSVQVDEQDKKDGRLLVNTLPDKLRSPDSLSSEIKPTYFGLTVCYVDTDGASVILENPSASYAKTLDDGGEYGIMFSYNFDYDVHAGGKYYTFCPQDTLPLAWEPYKAALPLSCDVGTSKLSGELPLTLTGETRVRPSDAEWQTAFARLKKDIEVFGIVNDPEIRQITRDPENHTAAELEYVRYWIILSGVYFCQREREAYQRMDELYSKYITVSSALVKAGDYGIEYILMNCWGGQASIAAACFINPFKNMLYTYLGECIAANSFEGGELRFMQALYEGTQNALTEALAGGLRPEPEKIGYVIAAFLTVSFVRHYRYGEGSEKGDVYKSVIAACADLGFAKLRGYISDNLEKAWDYIGQWFGQVYKLFFAKAIEKTAAAAGAKAFEASMRETVKKGAVEAKDLVVARAERGFAYATQKDNMMKALESETEALTETVVAYSKNAVEVADITLAAVLNYLMGGKPESGEAYGATTADVLVGFLQERFNIKAWAVEEAVADTAVATVVVEDGVATATVLGVTVAIPLRENEQTILDMIIAGFFDWWMGGILDAPIPDPDKVPDMRDKSEENLDTVDEQLDKLKNLKPIDYESSKESRLNGADEQMGGQ